MKNVRKFIFFEFIFIYNVRELERILGSKGKKGIIFFSFRRLEKFFWMGVEEVIVRVVVLEIVFFFRYGFELFVNFKKILKDRRVEWIYIGESYEE